MKGQGGNEPFPPHFHNHRTIPPTKLKTQVKSEVPVHHTEECEFRGKEKLVTF